MTRLLIHIKRYIFRGLLSIIPFALSIFAVRLLYVSIDQRVVSLLGDRVGFRFPGLGLLLVLLSLYLLGLLATNFLGRKAMGFAERISRRIPIIRTTYQVGKQLADTFSLPGGQTFKRAVLVECLKPGIWTVGFVTGTVIDRQQNGETLLKVYIPTPPNPASGNILVVRERETRNPGWTVEEALKVVLSGGIIGPEEIG